MALPWLLYGANGYTGELVAREARRRGLAPILAGRRRDPIAALAGELGLPFRIFELESTEAVARELDDVRAVLHCAGPFRRTHAAVVGACLERRVHYLDITGEIPVFESIASRDAAARRAGITLLPGAGFDVVPSDCLAAHLKRRLPTASRLALGFAGSGGVSRGTLRTALEQAGSGSAVRHRGRLVTVPIGALRRRIDFGSGPRHAVAIPWGDLATAWRSTGIVDLETYMAVPALALAVLPLLRVASPLLATATVRRALVSWAAARPPGPDAAARARGRSRVWGEARTADGQIAVSRLSAPEGYSLTVATSLLLIERVLRGEAPPGYQTPATAFGPDLVLAVEGVQRSDEP